MSALPLLDDGLEKLAGGRPWVFRALGESMRGQITNGSLVTLLPLERPRIGDILLAKQGEHMELHRAVWRRGNSWLLKGDRNLRIRGFERPELLARVVRIEHQGHVRDLTTPIARMRAILSTGLAWTPLLRQKLRSLF